jgi:hypothetical protein
MHRSEWKFFCGRGIFIPLNSVNSPIKCPNFILVLIINQFHGKLSTGRLPIQLVNKLPVVSVKKKSNISSQYVGLLYQKLSRYMPWRLMG